MGVGKMDKFSNSGWWFIMMNSFFEIPVSTADLLVNNDEEIQIDNDDNKLRDN